MFKSIIDGFTGIKNIIINVAQIALVGILVPFIAIIINAINSAAGGGATEFGQFMNGLIFQIPMFEEIANLLVQTSGSFSISDMPTITLMTLLQAFPDTMLVSVCVHFFDQLFSGVFDKKAHPLPIFAPFLGIATATIILNLLHLFKSVLVVILAEITMIIGIIIMVRGVFGRRKKDKYGEKKSIFSFGRILVFIINGLHGIIAASYAVVVLMAFSGTITGFGNIVKFLAPISLIAIIASVIVLHVNDLTQKEYV